MNANGFYKGKSVVVCGGGGFLGSFLVDALLADGAKVRVAQRTQPVNRLSHCLDQVEYIPSDLRNLDECRMCLKGADVVFNAAAKVGGIQYNMAHPGEMFYSNAELALNVQEGARLEGIERVVITSSTCVYPRDAPVPTPEEYGLVDQPDQANIGYGWAKRMEELGARFYGNEYGMNLAVVRLTNLYGPRDNFDPIMSHVIPALIRRALEAERYLDVWGSGKQMRSFLYVKDAARALLAAGEQYTVGDPINVGTEEEVTIQGLVELIIESTGRSIEVRFDPSAPEGQPRKAADVNKAKQVLDWRPQFNLREGLLETVKWYSENERHAV